MGSTRAVMASIGVSVSLVAAAALSLFVVSLVIAFGGWSAGMGDSQPATTLVLGASAPMPTRTEAARRLDPVVLRRAAPSRPRRSAPAPAHAVARTGADAHASVISHAVITKAPPRQLPAPVATKPAAAAQIPPVGDGVRRVGEDLSSTVSSTGKALADITAPLGPPVSAAVQRVLDLVATVLQRTTNGLGGTLDALAQK